MRSIPQCLFIPIGEDFGLLVATQWLSQCLLGRPTTETYCKTVVDLIHFPSSNIMELGAIVDDCKRTLVSFPNLEVRFVRKQANQVAHLRSIPLDNSFKMFK